MGPSLSLLSTRISFRTCPWLLRAAVLLLRRSGGAVLRETEDHEEIIERIAALDIGKAEVVSCVRVPSDTTPGRRMQEVQTYSTMTRSLLAMADRFGDLGVTRVVMEATSDYWKPPFYLLEAAGFDTWLVNARDVKHLPGRPKTDKLDAVWLCKVAERQMIRPSFVPPPQIRRLRDLTRYRVDLVAACTAEKNRAEKLLEDAQIKLSVVASDIFGVSGRDMMRALIAGQRDPQVLAQLARARMRVKIGALEEAFVGHFTDHHAFLLAKMLARVEAIEADITDVEHRIEEHVAPFATATDRLDEIPGVCPAAAHHHRRDRPGHDPVPHRRTPVLLGPLHPDRQGIGRQEEGQERHRSRQPLPSPGPRRGRRLRQQNRHLPRRTLPPDRQTPRQEEGHRRGRPLHPGHRLAPALRPRRPLPRPRSGLLRHPHRPRTQEAPPSGSC
jgi:transposase